MKNGAVAFGMLALAELAAAQSACLSLTSEFPPCAVRNTTLFVFIMGLTPFDSLLASVALRMLSAVPTLQT